MNYDVFKQRYNISLNPQQERAVRKVDGPALLLAVPGSGKTTVIVARVGYMMFCAGILPENILTLTFSRAAASEMKQRFCAKFGTDAAEKLHFSTIHSFCLSIIRKCEAAYGLHIPRLVTDNRSVIRKVCLGRNYENSSEIMVNELSRYISYCKNMLITGIRLEGIRMGGLDFRRFYEEYEEYKEKNDLMDFDDQLLLAYRLLGEYPEILNAVQDRYRYINIDEAQDTSLIQHRLIAKVSSKYENIFMVGDEDQSIYGFRAAYPDALLRFGKDHPGAEIMLLETNYRCSENIVEAADRIIRTNKNRYEKNMRAVRGKGRIYETKLRDVRYQYRYLVKALREAAVQGREVAVLYRNNESAVPLIDLLDKEGIGFESDADISFYSHNIVKDIICILRLILNPNDLAAYRDIYHKLGLYTTRSQFAMVKESIDRHDPGTIFEILAKFEGRHETARQIREFGKELSKLRDQCPFDVLCAVDRLFYRKWLQRQADEGTESIRGLEHKLNTLLALSAEYTTNEEYISRIEHLARRRSSLASEKSKDSAGSSPENSLIKRRNYVTLSTIHSSKGMEFDKVILIDVYNGIFPSGKGSNITGAGDDGREEEVRLFYVALTRARDEIEVITAPKIFGMHLERSPFIDMLFASPRSTGSSIWSGVLSFGRGADGRGKPADQKARYNTAVGDDPAERYAPGSKLKHRYFGEGTIINRTGDIISVRFKEGDKNISLSAGLKWGYIEPPD